MKKRKVNISKIFCSSFTIIFLCLFACCIFCRFSYKPFNSKETKKDIEYYSSDKFKGRLCGHFENILTKESIISYLKKNNLKPLSNTYDDSFKTIVPIKKDSNPSLKVLDKNDNIITEYTLGSDYKEDGINFKSSSVKFNNENIKISKTSIIVSKDKKNYIFYVTDNDSFSFRSSFIYDCPIEFAIQISQNTYTSMIKYLSANYSISMDLPYTIEEREVANICFFIEGTSNNLPPIILTAHYDHVGTDSLNNIYNGALDNASGFCFLINFAKNLSSLPSPNRDIIFVLFNGEELGLKGSEHFAQKFKDKYNGCQVINLDMIGANNYTISFVQQKDARNELSNTLDSLEQICLDNNIPYKIKYENSSDHASFNTKYYDAITLCQEDMTNLHTPEDTYEKISTKDLDKIYLIMYKKVISDCYSNKNLIFYKNSTLIACTLLLISSLSLTITLFYKKEGLLTH